MTDTTELRRRLREALSARKRLPIGATAEKQYADAAIRHASNDLLAALDAEDAARADDELEAAIKREYLAMHPDDPRNG